MKKLFTTVAIAACLVGCSKPSVKEAPVEEPTLKTSFYVSTDTQQIISDEEVNGKMVIDWYYDGACGSCQYIDTELTDSYTDTLTEDKVVRYTPTAFIGQSEESYSAQYAGYQLAINEVDPAHGVAFMNKMLNYLDTTIDRKNFTEDTFKSKYLSIDGTNEDLYNQIASKKDDYVKAVVKNSQELLHSKELADKIPEGTSNLYIPFIVPGHAEKGITFNNIETEEDMKNLLKNTITEQVEKDKQWEEQQAEKTAQEEQAKAEAEKKKQQLLTVTGILVAITVIGISVVVLKNIKNKN